MDALYAVYYDVEKSQFLLNRAAVRINNPVARELLCALRDRDMELAGIVQREIARVEQRRRPASILLPDQDDQP